MIVLSLFDGMSCGQIALERLGVKVGKYYASEIDKYAIKVTQCHYPNTIQLGDINNWKSWDIEIPDVILAGSPCQGFSNAGKGLNFDDPRSKLFFVFLDILNYYKQKNPKLIWLLENVKMKKEWQDKISELVGVRPILINSALVSAQNRNRLYWTNIQNITQPEDKHIYLKDILEDNVDSKFLGGYNPTYKSQSNSLHDLNGKSNVIGAGTHGYALGFVPVVDKSRSVRTSGRGSFDRHNWDMIKVKTVPHGFMKDEIKERDKYPSLVGQSPDTKYLVQVGIADDIKGHGYNKRVYSSIGKSPTLATHTGGNLEPKVALDDVYYRKLIPIECERLQTVPDNWTSMVSNTQRYKMLGNGWTIDVIVHILSFANLL